MELVGFYVFGAIAVIASLLVVAIDRPMYSVLLLVVALAALSGLYVLLDAPFIAVIQIIIYAGAIMVLMLFTVMLLNKPREEPSPPGDHSFGAVGARRAGVVVAALLLGELLWAVARVRGTGSPPDSTASAPALGSVREIGRVLFTNYGFAFEVTSILILVALLGAVVMARRP